MTISSETRKAGPYTGNGVTTTYPFSFKVFTTSEVVVIRTNLSGIESTLVLGTDYTVTLNSNQNSNPGGSVVLTSALTSGFLLTLTSDVALLQATDLTNQGGFYPTVINDALDKLTIICQQLNEQVSRAALVDISSSASAAALVSNINLLAANLATLQAVSSDQSNIDAVAADLTNINTVAGNTTNINTVAGINSNVTTVAGNSTNINTVATNISSVNSAATNMSAIIAAPTQATNAANSANAAAASAVAAAASAASGMYSAVQDKSANYTVVAGDAGDLLRVSTGSGAVTITLPQISTVSDGFKVAVVKWTGDTNAVTIARSGSDTINGATSATIGSQYTQITLVADFETNQWFAATSGLGSTNVVVDTFSGNGSTTAFTLSGDPGAKNNTYVFISGVYQQKSKYTWSGGTTLNFVTAPPSGTSNIEVVWTQPLAVGVPSDGTVTAAKLSSSAITDKLGYTPANDSLVAHLAGAETFTAAKRGAPVALTDAATITPDFSAGNNFSVTLGGNRTLANPTNLTAGQAGIIVITQDGTGSRTLAYGSYFKFPAGTAPTLTTTASAVDVLAYYVESSTRITARLIGDVK